MPARKNNKQHLPVEVKNNQSIFKDEFLPKERDIVFSNDVTQATIGELSKIIININAHDASLTNLYAVRGFTYVPKPIHLFIDSYGGDVYSVLGLIGIIECSMTPVHSIATGTAMSAGFLMGIACQKRYCYPRTTFMAHQISSLSMGEVETLREEMIELDRLQEICEDIIFKHTKINRSKWNAMLKKKQDYYINADEALKLGVVDQVIQNQAELYS